MKELFENNVAWAESIKQTDAQYFENLSKQQAPEYLWIGCSDSRVPANQIVGKAPGEVFVHRNIANMVVHTDLNCLSVMHYAVEYLQVKHIIVCGHYGCGGVMGAVQNARLGLIDNWLRNIQDVQRIHNVYLEEGANEQAVYDRVCELNVVEQAVNVCKTSIVQDAWERGQNLTVHGLIYSLKDGLLKDLGINISAVGQIDQVHQSAVEKINGK